MSDKVAQDFFCCLILNADKSCYEENQELVFHVLFVRQLLYFPI